MMIIPTQTAYEVRSGYVLPEQTVNPMIPQWQETTGSLTWIPSSRTSPLPIPRAVMTVVQKPGVAAPVGALRTLGGIAVCRSQGGFCQDIQVISATSSVSGAVTRARPSP